MISDLPLPQNNRLPGAPLEVVVWQLQFAESAAVAEARVGQHLADALADHAQEPPHLTRITPPTFTVAVGAGAAPTEVPGAPPINGWRAQANELVATIDQASISLETTKFSDWATFRASIASILDAFAAAVPDPPGEQRLGLRYVDRIWRSDVTKLTDWDQWLESWLLGPASHPQLGEAVTAIAQQVDCNAGEGLRMTVRQRVFNDRERQNQPTAVLDFDAFRDGYRPFQREDIMSTSDELNDVSHRLFRAAITDRLYDAMREEPTAE